MIVVLAVSHGAVADAANFGWESWEMGWTARSIFLGQGFSSPYPPVTGPTALVPPLYPYLIAGFFKLFGLNSSGSALAILSFNSICSSLTCISLYLLARTTLSERTSRIVAIASAIYPFSVYFSATRIWDYAVTALLFTCCLLLAQTLPRRGNGAWLGFGLLYGVTVHSNPSVTSLLPFLLLIAAAKVRRAGGPWFSKTLLASVAFISVCIPWVVRNERVLHAPVFVRDGFWQEFYAGNNGDASESNSRWAHPSGSAIELKRYEQLGEIGYSAEKHELATAFVQRHPLFFAVATARRAVRFWLGFWSFSRSYLRYEPMDVPNVFFCIFLFVFTLRGLTRWLREDRSAALIYLIAVLVFPLPYYLSHSSMDYRQPLEPMLIILLTVGLFGTGRTNPETEAAVTHTQKREAVMA